MGGTQPVVTATGELMKRGQMLTKTDILSEISPVQRLQQLNSADWRPDPESN